jgi:membrane-bound lytic murein transglycosylase MltF
MRLAIAKIVICIAAGYCGIPSAIALETSVGLTEDLRTPWTGDYDGMLERRKIRVLIPFSKTYFFLNKGKRHGIAVEWLREFEKLIHQDIPAKADRPAVFLIPTRRDRLIPDLAEGRGDIAIGNLTITPERLRDVDFSNPLHRGVTEVLVTPKSEPERTGLAGLAGLKIHVRRSSSYFESLQSANAELRKQKKEPIEIVEINDLLEDEDLLEMVNAELLPAMIIDNHKASFWLEVFDNIRVHENATVREDGEIAWAFRKNSPKLKAKVDAFVETASAGTMLGNILIKRYYRDAEWLKKATSQAHKEKIAALTAHFRKYGEQYQIDWLILAALAFKESRFDQNAKGPTGALGIMQIKQSTADSEAVNVRDISRAEGNIHAGAKYLRYLADTYFPGEEIGELDRIFFALASYNAGPNRIAGLRKKSANPNVWFDNVEDTVSQDVGLIPVRYVLNIYEYYVAFQLGIEGHEQKIKALGVMPAPN